MEKLVDVLIVGISSTHFTVQQILPGYRQFICTKPQYGGLCTTLRFRREECREVDMKLWMEEIPGMIKQHQRDARSSK